MNIHKVWEQGITGKGIVVAVVDDGLQESHPELRDNYVSAQFLANLEIIIEKSKVPPDEQPSFASDH